MVWPNGTIVAPRGKAFDLEFAQTSKWEGDQLIAISAFWSCEAMYTLQNTQDGTGLGISFWRDQDALDAAMSGAIKLANDGARANGLSISPMTVYDVVTER